MAAVAILAASFAILRATWRHPIPNREEAVRIAAARLMSVDATFRPEGHVARVDRVCGSPLHVDFFKVGGASVVHRVSFSERHGMQGPSSWPESFGVGSDRDGGGRFLLGATGDVVGFRRD